MQLRQEAVRAAVNPVVREGQTDETLNTATHGIGLLLSFAAGALLLMRAYSLGDPWHFAACLIYSSTMVAVYAASTLSHAFSEPRLKRLFLILDQAAIYLFIAGSFTPFAFVYLRDGYWWVLTAAVWAIAITGCMSKLFFNHRIYGVAVWFYVLLGWLPALSFPYMAGLLPQACTVWMCVGGLFYTLGTIFLVLDKKDYHFHAIWHLMVIAGTASQFVAIYNYVGAPVS